MEPTSINFNKNSQVRRQRRIKILLVGILVLLAMIALLIGFLRKPEYQISSVVVTGAKSLDPLSVQQTALGFLSGHYVWVIPKTNALLFSKASMNNYLMANYPGIASVDTKFSERNKLSITLTEKKPVYLWCDQNNTCYFVDESGMIYEASPSFSPGAFIQFSGSLIPMGSQILRARFASVNDFAKTIAQIETLQAYPMDVLGVNYLENGTVAVPNGETTGSIRDVAITFDQIKDVVVDPSAQLLIPENATPDQILKDLALLANDQAFENLLASEPNQLDYIDFRFDGKIYYKFGVMNTSAGAVTSTPVSITTPSAPAPTTPSPNKKPTTKKSSH